MSLKFNPNLQTNYTNFSTKPANSKTIFHNTSINFNNCNTSNHCEPLVAFDKNGNKTVTVYSPDGTQKTIKHYIENSTNLHFTETFNTKDDKLIKKSIYNILTNKICQENEYKENGRTERYYDDNGNFTGKVEIIRNKDGSVRLEEYNSNDELTGYKIQIQVDTTTGKKRPIYEIKTYDAQDNLLKIEPRSYASIDQEENNK